MTNVNVSQTTKVTIPVEEFLEKLGLDKYQGVIDAIDVYNGMDGFTDELKPVVEITLLSSFQEVSRK